MNESTELGARKDRGMKRLERAAEKDRDAVVLARLYVLSRKSRGLRIPYALAPRMRIQIRRGKRKTESLGKGFQWALSKVLRKSDDDYNKIGHGGIAKAMVKEAKGHPDVLAVLKRAGMYDGSETDEGEMSGLGMFSVLGDLGVVSRLRTIAGMQNEIKNRKAAIVRFKRQLKKAKGDEKSKLHGLIKKYQGRIKELHEAIKEKKYRKGGRERWWERAETRASVFSGDLGSTFNSESGWWKPILVLGGIGLLAWLAPKFGTTRKGANYGGAMRSNPGPTAAQRKKLLETYAVYTHSTGVHHGPTRDKLYKQWMKAEDKVLNAAGIQYLNDENRAALDKAAKKWWDSRAFRGAGVDW